MINQTNQQAEQAALKNIVYWPDGYFIADHDAESQGEILDSVEAFGSQPHTVLSVPVGSDREQMQQLVNNQLAGKTI